jgi:hypothetical protein
MQSPLSGLCEVLRRVKKLAVHNGYEQQLKKNEKQTRAALIDPVLISLGWDIADPQQVEHEKQITTTKDIVIIDYYLKSEFPIIVEAKKLGGDLDDHLVQIADYSRRTGIKSIFLTDGVIWQHHINSDAALNNQNSNLNFNMAKRINLSEIDDNDLPKEAAAYFVEHLDAALFLKHPKQPDVNELKNNIATLELAIRGIEARLPPQPDPPQYITPPPPWCILNETNWDPRNKRPQQLWLPGKVAIDVRGWSQVLTETCRYCLETNPDLVNPLPILDRVGKTLNLIGVERPANAYSTIMLGEQELYVNTNYDANNAIKNAVYMLEKLSDGTASKAAVLLAE